MADQAPTPKPADTAFRDLAWEIRLSALYHLKRERFLDGLDRAASFIAALGGAAAFAKLQENPCFGLWVTGLVAVVSMIALVYSPAARARHHAELARDFRLLDAELSMVDPSDNEDRLAKLRYQYLTKEASEPPALGALVTHCHNELCEAIGAKDDVTPLPWHQSLLKNWFDFNQTMSSEPDRTPA